MYKGITQLNIIQNRFCRLVFGLNSSPAILNFVLRRRLIQGEGHKYINFLLTESLYVDDFVGGGANDDESFKYITNYRISRRSQGLS